EHHIVRQVHVVADLAIVADVSADHDEAAVADPRDATAVFGADVHGDALAQLAARADDQFGRAAAIMHRLRRRAERGERIDHGALADRGDAGDVDVADKTHAVFELDLRPDQAIRPDL